MTEHQNHPESATQKIIAEMLSRAQAVDGRYEPDPFRIFHSMCGGLTSERVGWENLGIPDGIRYPHYEYAPIKVVRCTKHGVASKRFTDMDAFDHGEMRTTNHGGRLD